MLLSAKSQVVVFYCIRSQWRKNTVADLLSRIESISEIDYDKIADAHVDNKELNELRLKPSLNFKQYPLDSGKLLWCDISIANIRPFIPQPLRMHMFQKIHNLAHAEGIINCLTCIDRFARWIEVIPLSNITAETVDREFYNHWIPRFGMSYRVLTDQGTQFRSQLFKNIGVICGFKYTITANSDKTDGLPNGAVGELIHLETNDEGLVKTIGLQKEPQVGREIKTQTDASPL
ncbi:transposon Tf2-9 polyprotein [Trichonephila clavipes]|nr:transposon Tf2-9 polyprotein [Trichonephila clavipes]